MSNFLSRENIYKQAIQEYKELYFKKYKINHSPQEATSEAMALLNGMRTLLNSDSQMKQEVVEIK